MALIGAIEFDDLPGIAPTYHRIDSHQYNTGGGVLLRILSYMTPAQREKEVRHEIAKGYIGSPLLVALSVEASEAWWQNGTGTARELYGYLVAEDQRFANCVSDEVEEADLQS